MGVSGAPPGERPRAPPGAPTTPRSGSVAPATVHTFARPGTASTARKPPDTSSRTSRFVCPWENPARSAILDRVM